MSEDEAIEVLKSFGWQIVTGAHLEDWNEGETVVDENGWVESMQVRSDIAIVKINSRG